MNVSPHWPQSGSPQRANQPAPGRRPRAPAAAQNNKGVASTVPTESTESAALCAQRRKGTSAGCKGASDSRNRTAARHMAAVAMYN